MLNYVIHSRLSRIFLRNRGRSKALLRVVPEPYSSHSVPPIIVPPEKTVGPLPKPNRQEKSDDYSRIVLRVNDDWRVIECMNTIQWILQKRKGNHEGKPAWSAVSFCRSRGGLRRCLKKDTGIRSGIFATELRKLPRFLSK